MVAVLQRSATQMLNSYTTLVEGRHGDVESGGVAGLQTLNRRGLVRYVGVGLGVPHQRPQHEQGSDNHAEAALHRHGGTGMIGDS